MIYFMTLFCWLCVTVAAVSVPLHRAGMSKMRSFFYGQLSGMVEPIAGLIGALAVNSMQAILPYALGFAAGVQCAVVVA